MPPVENFYVFLVLKRISGIARIGKGIRRHHTGVVACQGHVFLVLSPMLKSILPILFAFLVAGLSTSAWAGISGLCDCQYVECSPDRASPVQAICVWLSTKTTVQVISVDVVTPDKIAPACQEAATTIDFSRLPNLKEEFRLGLTEGRGQVVCEELRFF